MNFLSSLTLNMTKKDANWVIVDCLTKTVHFLVVRTGYTFERLVEIYITKIVQFNGVPVFITFDRDAQFTSRFWKSLQGALYSKLNFSTSYHSQIDGQSGRVVQVLEDMIRSCVFELVGWMEHYLSLVEFSYNKSYQASIPMAPFEALYGRRCQTPLRWAELDEKQIVGPKLVCKIEDKVRQEKVCFRQTKVLC